MTFEIGLTLGIIVLALVLFATEKLRVDLIANAMMLQNVVDMTDALHEMALEGYLISPEAVATLSPYLRKKTKRFGEYVIDTETIPPPLNPDKPVLTPGIS